MKRLYVLGFSLVAVLLPGCGKRPAPDAPRAAGTRQVLNLGNGAEPQDLDPHTATGVPEADIIRSLLEGLVIFDPRTLEPRPGQAERWTISPDGLVYIFYLRANAAWSNGEPVTAHDFVRSAQRMLAPVLAAEYAYHYYPLAGAEEFNKGQSTDFAAVGIKALDDRTLRLTLHSPTSYFLNLLLQPTWSPVHVPTIEKFGGVERRGSAWTRAGNYVGNGPFVLSAWKPNQVITLKRSPTYWGRSEVKLEEVNFYPVDNADTEERMFRTGQLDITKTLALSKIDPYRDAKDPALRLEPYLSVAYMRVNTTRAHLADVRVRRALALAMERESLCKNVLRGTKFPAYQLTPAGTAGFNPSPQFSDDVATARRLLAEAGFPGGKGLPSIEILYPSSDNGRVVMEALQEMWRRNLGLDIRLQNLEWKVYLDTLNTLNYDVSWSAWGGDYVEPMTFLDTLAGDSGNNRTGWKDVEYDQMITAARQTNDRSARYAQYEKMEQLIGRDAPILPLYFYSSVYLAHPKVKGWFPTPLNVHPLQAVSIDR